MYKNIIIFIATFFGLSCYQKPTQQKAIEDGYQIKSWSTSADQLNLLNEEQTILKFSKEYIDLPTIEIDLGTSYQEIDGFGYTMTGGSAYLISQMEETVQESLIEDLFSCTNNTGCINYLRLSIGASDLDENVYSYNDLPEGMTDPELKLFSIQKDSLYLLPLLKKIIKINPDIKFLATAWSPPVWMKSNQNTIGGSLLNKYYDTYALYFLKYIQAMQKNGVSITALTLQNEPEHGGNNPSMLMSSNEQSIFIKNHLGPLLKKNNITTKIVIWDHNCDNIAYPISILNDSITRKYIDGSAFHLYAGVIDNLSKVKELHPDKNIYFTEQWTGAKGDFGGDLMWHMKNVIIGSIRNHSKIVLEWNLANDPNYEPHTHGGCTEC
ncbi:MAG TPA: glucosylceramidase, partial [Saprospiraceae bacterium]|nr:glucosylceramidase [Saprospiraceae bacterium]